MTPPDLDGLPLFANRSEPELAPAECPPPAPVRRPIAVLVIETPAQPTARAATARPTAEMIPFPCCRNVRLVRDLAGEFLKLRHRHGDRARSVLLETRFKPLRARLRRLKVTTDVIRQEMKCLEAEVARLVWEADGCPGADADGGDAA